MRDYSAPQQPRFQSTLSVRRATNETAQAVNQLTISIHALRKESDMMCMVSAAERWIFQSTLSVRRATARPTYPLTLFIFQSTLSVRRATVQLDIFVHFLRRKPAAWL